MRMSAEQELEAARKAAIAQLTPEERAAMEDELSDDEKESLRAVASMGDDDDEDDDEDDADEKDGKSSAKAEEKANDKSEDEVAVRETDEPKVSGDFKPKFKAELPEDYDAQVAALADEEAALVKRFKDGDMEADEFLAQQRAISAKQGDLRALKTKAETFEELNSQSAEQEWAWHVEKFLAKVKAEEGIDYRGDADKGGDFDSFVRALANKPANADKPYEWFLSEAHKRTKALHGVAEKAPEKDEKAEEKAGQKPEKRKPPVKDIPPNLSNVAGSEGPGDVGGDEFSDLDKLDGLAYETALAKLTPAQRERYLETA